MKKEDWFLEGDLLGITSNVKMAVKVKKRISSFKTPFQKGEILDTFGMGRLLVLDGIVQLAEKDEFIYHEMITHLPMFSHPEPKKILVVGGGDGGVLREVLKHPIKEVDLVEIDKEIIEISKKYLPFIPKKVFSDKKVKIFIEDGVKFVRKKEPGYFDIAIIDSTDPNNTSLPIFTQKFYRSVSRILADEGMMIIQSGTFWEQFRHVKKIYRDMKKVFPFVKIYRASIPSYLEAEYAFIIGSKKNVLENPDMEGMKRRYKKLGLKTEYYSPEIHQASGVLPRIYKPG
jgi:spermidine synthase